MYYIELVIEWFSNFISTYVVPPWVLIAGLLGTGLFLTLRLSFIQIRRFGHGVAVTTGKYDEASTPGDVSHFQALTTALSATVGVGNIAGVAIAIHWGGPGALFWMWCTAFFGMAVKYSEVTLALKYRKEDDHPEQATAIQGTVSGGPMYYIEKGMKAKPLAVFFAIGLLLTSFLTGNAIQANTLSDLFHTKFGIETWITGGLSCLFVGIVIFGGIRRIGKVTAVLAPLMACLYILGALAILFMNADQVLPAFQRILVEAFNPVSGVAGTGAGVFLMTLEWGVKRGLFSNEAGQGSAPIAHSAAQTDEPVSEGVVALLEPFIDTLVICTLTGLVIISTGSWTAKHPTRMPLAAGDISYVSYSDQGTWQALSAPERIVIQDGVPGYQSEQGKFAWNDVPVDTMFLDPGLKFPLNGTLLPSRAVATVEKATLYSNGVVLDPVNLGDQKLIFVEGQPQVESGQNPVNIGKVSWDLEGNLPFSGSLLGSGPNGFQIEIPVIYGEAVETSAPLTAMAFSKDLGSMGEYIVILCVALFAISTAISWSYYGDRCSYYLFGKKSIVIYKIIFLAFHYIGAMASLNVIWGFGDVALSIVTIPNLIALFVLSGTVLKLSNSYFERRPWEKKEKS